MIITIFFSGPDIIEATDDPNFHPHSRMHQWKDVNESDMKIFMALVILMGLTRKANIVKYWSKSKLISTPTFRKYITRMKFELILKCLHLTDNSLDNGDDPLYKLRPFITMCRENFLHVYTPNMNLSLDEASCPYKGRLRFKVYNKNKPNKFHIKLFQVCEAKSGYVCDFEIYTGKDESASVRSSRPLDPDVTKTTKLVLGMMENANLLDKGHHLYLDNYYSSPELCEELYFRDTFTTGTVRLNRKGIPLAVRNAKLKTSECVFRRKEHLLVLKWCDKRPVKFVSTIHDANDIVTRKKDRAGNFIQKPQIVVDYTSKMRGCDVSDQLLQSYTLLRRSVKWWRKLFFHLFSVVLGNAYILHKKYGHLKINHEEYLENIAHVLLQEGEEEATIIPQTRKSLPDDTETIDEPRLNGKHFAEPIPAPVDIGKRRPSRACHACNFTERQIASLGKTPSRLKRRNSSYWCSKCKVALCVHPCFEIYHTKINYRNVGLERRLLDDIH